MTEKKIIARAVLRHWCQTYDSAGREILNLFTECNGLFSDCIKLKGIFRKKKFLSMQYDQTLRNRSLLKYKLTIK